MRAVDLESEPEPDSGLEARVFTGYSGWGPGQLESELSNNGWFVVDAAMPTTCSRRIPNSCGRRFSVGLVAATPGSPPIRPIPG